LAKAKKREQYHDWWQLDADVQGALDAGLMLFF
jgi:hypothetical protein